MANINQYLQAIMNAVYGEEVRGSIHDAIELINDVGEALFSAGTAIDSPTSSSEGFYDNSFYLNDSTWDIWKCTGTNAWSLVCNIKGSGIDDITKTSTSGLIDTYTITFDDGTTETFDVTNGKTAYQSAVEGGYPGTEAQFEADLANFKEWKEDADERAEDAEAYAIGERNGVPVGPTDPAYQNNSKYYSDMAAGRGATHVCTINPNATAEYAADWLMEDSQVVTPNPKDIYMVEVDDKMRQFYWDSTTTKYEILSGGGHTILKTLPNGSILPMGQRDSMLFEDIKVTDDETNNRTVIHGQLKVCETEADWNQLSQAEKDDPNTYWVRPWADTVAFATDKTPVGAVLSVATGKTEDGISGITTPTGTFPTDDYLVCDGQTVSPSTYPALAAYFQTRYGDTYYFGGTAPGNFSLPNWSSDFPSNGVLVMKARESSNAMSITEIDDTSVSEDKTWSSKKIHNSIVGDGTYVTVASYSALQTALTNKVATMTPYTIENMVIACSAVFTEFPMGGNHGVQIYKGGANTDFTAIIQGYHAGELKYISYYGGTWTFRNVSFKEDTATELTVTSGTVNFTFTASYAYRYGNHIHAEVYGTYGADVTTGQTIPFFKISGTKAPSANKYVGTVIIMNSSALPQLVVPSLAQLRPDGYIHEVATSNLSNGMRLGFIVDYYES